jgi:hypothetical protein
MVLPDEDTLDVQRTMQAICHYLARHPVAADSAGGIAQWWLPPMGVDVTLGIVQSALAQLAAEGRVQRRLMPDGRALYGAPRA